MEEMEIFKWAVGQGGGYVIAIVLIILWRNENRRKADVLLNEIDRRDRLEAQLLKIIADHAGVTERLVVSINKLDTTIMEHHRLEVSWMERLTKELGVVGHDVKNLMQDTRSMLRSRVAGPSQ